jgi:pimeloyl-ACP methyl ester carboxylesterase
MPFSGAEDRSLHYVQLPSDSGPEAEHLVMVHGLAASMGFWYFDIAPKLSKVFNVTLYDLIGHGRSRMPLRRYGPKNMANDLRDLLDCLDIERTHVIGHSFGGLIGLHLANDCPDRVRTLTVADSQLSSVRRLSQPWEHGQKIKRLLRQRGLDFDVQDPYFGFHMLKEAARLQVADRHHEMEALREWVHPFIGRAGKRSARQWLRLVETTGAETDFISDDNLTDSVLKKMSVPTLAVYGERSQAVGSGQKLAHLLPGAELKLIPRAGHFFPVSKPKALLAAWIPFVRQFAQIQLSGRRVLSPATNGG